MYELLRRPERRPWATPADWQAVDRKTFAEADSHVAVRMEENRAPFGPAEKRVIALIATIFAVIGLMALARGYWPVPLFCAAVFAALTVAMRRHRNATPAAETLEFLSDRVRHRDRRGRATDWDGARLRLKEVERSPADLRLILGEAGRTREIGTCLSLEERRELAAIVSATLNQTRRNLP